MVEQTKEKPKPQTLSNSPRVYSYDRLSKTEQDFGDGERRQLSMAEAFAKRKGFILDKSLRLFDKGKSGYYGDNRKKGVLGQFLRSVENGLVPRGSILLVENIDRLSREGVVTTLKEIIFKLWDHGITLQTLSPEESYEPGCDNAPKFMALWLYMNRAHSESFEKSRRITDARNMARENARTKGTQMTSRCPAWLKPEKKESKNKNELEIEFTIIPEAQKTLEMMFDLKLKGVGKGTIVKRLNKEAPWQRPNGWSPSYVNKILQYPAVIGEYQPYQRNDKAGERNDKTGKPEPKRVPVSEPIQGYFPEVIKPEIFYAVQELFKVNKGKGGRTGKVNNLFTHLVKCSYCGGSMTFVDKGKPPKGKKHLICYNGKRDFGCSKEHKISYDEAEKAILENCTGLHPEQVLPSSDERIKLCHSLSQRIQGKKGEIRDIDERVENLDDHIENSKYRDRREEHEERINKLKQQKKILEAEIEDDEREHRKARSALQSFARWQNDLASLQKALKTGDIEIRMRMRSHLQELIEKIDVFAVGFKKIYNVGKDDDEKPWRNLTKWKAMTKEERRAHRQPKYSDNTETIEDYLYDVVREVSPELASNKSFGNFVKDLTKRRMSKEGRFLRIHFKTGIWVDVVPEGSLATGSKLYLTQDKKANWCHFVGPDIDKLLNEWYKGKGKKIG